MGNVLLTTSFVDSIGSASTSATNFPASRLVTRARPFVRPWRSTVTTTTTITITLIDLTDVKLIILYHANFTSVVVNSVSYTISQHPWDKRYKLAIVTSGNLNSIDITIPTQTPVDGAAYFQLGRVFAFDGYTELPLNPSAEMPFTLHDPQHTAQGPGVFESQQAGPMYYSEEMRGVWFQSTEATVMDALNVRGNEFVGCYLNMGRTYECDIRQRIGDESWQMGTTLLTGNPVFQQEP